MQFRSSTDVMTTILCFDPKLTSEDKVEKILQRLLDEYFTMSLYKHYKMVKSGYVRPSLSDSVLHRTAAVEASHTNVEKSRNPQKSPSDTKVPLLVHAGVDIDLMPRKHNGISTAYQDEPDNNVLDEGQLTSSDISETSSSSSLYSADSEVNDFFEGYMANIMPFHCNKIDDHNDDDDHDTVITVSSSDSVLSAVSSAMSVQSNTDYSYNPWDVELVGHYGDDEWTIGDPEDVTDLDAHQSHYLQQPPRHAPLDQAILKAAVPCKVPSDSVLIKDRKRKCSDFNNDDNRSTKIARVSVSDIIISCQSDCLETPLKSKTKDDSCPLLVDHGSGVTELNH